MRHATAKALDQLEPLLQAIRLLPTLKETSRGVFYRKDRAFLHFHEDPAGLFADLRTGADFQRRCVNAPEDRMALLAEISAWLEA
jgi:hypothetical protein